MAGITLAQAEAKLALWLTADDKVSKGQHYIIDGQQVTRAHAAEITRKIEFWDRQVKRLSRGGIRARAVTPL